MTEENSCADQALRACVRDDFKSLSRILSTLDAVLSREVRIRCLSRAARNDATRCAKVLITSMRDDDINAYNGRALFYACYFGSFGIVAQILRRVPQCSSYRPWTALEGGVSSPRARKKISSLLHRVRCEEDLSASVHQKYQNRESLVENLRNGIGDDCHKNIESLIPIDDCRALMRLAVLAGDVEVCALLARCGAPTNDEVGLEQMLTGGKIIIARSTSDACPITLEKIKTGALYRMCTSRPAHCTTWSLECVSRFETCPICRQTLQETRYKNLEK